MKVVIQGMLVEQQALYKVYYSQAPLDTAKPSVHTQ
jgi:hypothetical protein